MESFKLPYNLLGKLVIFEFIRNTLGTTKEAHLLDFTSYTYQHTSPAIIVCDVFFPFEGTSDDALVFNTLPPSSQTPVS